MKDSLLELYGTIRGQRSWPQVGVTIYGLSEIKNEQVGYRFDRTGQSLLGPRMWSPSWTVIGHENLCGDPIFVDSGGTRLPVFTAAHGQGEWVEVPISQSAEVFFDCLDLAEEALGGKLNRELALKQIASLNQSSEFVDLEFWSVLLEA